MKIYQPVFRKGAGERTSAAVGIHSKVRIIENTHPIIKEAFGMQKRFFIKMNCKKKSPIFNPKMYENLYNKLRRKIILKT